MKQVPLLISTCVLASLLFGRSSKAQTPPISEMHIAVHLTTVAGTPYDTLSNSNFNLLSNGSSYPISIAQTQRCGHSRESAFPTRALIVLPKGENISDPRVHLLVGKLKPLWNCKWEVSIRDGLNHQTPYVDSESELQSALRSDIETNTNPSGAFTALGAFTGRRVIVVTTGPQYTVDQTTIAAALKYRAMIYQVGSKTRSNYKVVGYQPDSNYMQFSSSGDVLASITVPGAPYVSSSPARTVITEKASLDAVMKQALMDSAGFYDLTAFVPEGSKAISLQFLSPKYAGKAYKITAQLYRDSGMLPDLSIKTSP